MEKESPSFYDHLKSILSLPFMVIIIVPLYISYSYEEKAFHFFDLMNEKVISFIGGFLFAIGVSLMIKTIFLFGKKGKGTLAPWNPPKKLVIVGPFRYVRNPMILGVNLILVSIAFTFSNENILLWMIFFLMLNTIYFIKKEEPDLVKRFGNDYVEYCKNVPRWIPRLTPWENKN